MAIATLFCVAAGVYAADDGWQYKDAEKTIIENTGLGIEKRSTALQKGETLNSGEEIESVSNVEVAGTADFASDKDSLNAIVLDSEKQNVAMADGSSINVEASTVDDQSAKAVVFSDEATSASLNGKGDVTVKASADAVAVESKGDAEVVITANSISATSANGNATAIDVKNAGDITVNAVSVSATNGTATALKAETAGNVNIASVTGNVDLGTAKDVGVITANGAINLGTATNVVVDTANDVIDLGTVESVTVSVAQSTVDVDAANKNITIAEAQDKGNSGDAETQSLVLTAYGDYALAENFDWYFGITYAFGMNEAERNDILGNKVDSDWDSHTINGFTGLRYSWKPYQDKKFYVKPLIGINATLVNNPNYGEEGTGDLMNVQSEDYASVKSVLGVEMTYGLDKLFFYGKLLYTHEFGDDSYDINSMFLNQNLATSTMFRAKGTEFDRDAGIFGVGAGYNINARWRVYIDYAAEFSSDVSHNLNLGAQYKF